MRRRLIAPLAAVAFTFAACSGDDAPAAPAPTAPTPTDSTPTDTTPTGTAGSAPGSPPPESSVPDAPAGTGAPVASGAPESTGAPGSTVAPADDEGLASGPEWSVAGALAELPDTNADQFELAAGDLTQIETLFGIERPESLADVDAVLDEWVLPLTFPGTAEYRELPLWVAIQEPLLPRDVRRLDEFDDLLGWSVLDVDSFVHYTPDGPGYLLAVRGEFADDALAGLVDVAPGVVSNGDAEDFAIDAAAISSIDALGRSVRFARAGDRIGVAVATPLAEDWLDRSGPTLADDAHLNGVAGALDAAGVLTAHLFRHDFSGVAAQLTPEQLATIDEALPISEPFDTVGIGWTVDAAGEPTVVLAFATSGDAAALADQVAAVFREGVSLATRQPMADILGSADPEVAVDGAVVTVTYQPGERFWWSAVQAVYQRDILFAHR